MVGPAPPAAKRGLGEAAHTVARPRRPRLPRWLVVCHQVLKFVRVPSIEQEAPQCLCYFWLSMLQPIACRPKSLPVRCVLAGSRKCEHGQPGRYGTGLGGACQRRRGERLSQSRESSRVYRNAVSVLTPSLSFSSFVWPGLGHPRLRGLHFTSAANVPGTPSLLAMGSCQIRRKVAHPRIGVAAALRWAVVNGFPYCALCRFSPSLVYVTWIC